MAERGHPTRILFLITKGNLGGAQRYVLDLVRTLPRERFECSVALGEPGGLERALRECGVRVIIIPELRRDISALHDLRALRAVMRLVKAERPDILHCNSSKAGLLGAVAGRVARLTGAARCRIVFTAHGWAFHENRSRAQQYALYALHFATVLLSDATIAVSEQTGRSMRMLRRRISVVENGVGERAIPDTQTARKALASRSTSLAAAFAAEPGALWLGVIAEHHRNKGLDILLDALAQARPARPWLLALVGDGEERSRLETKMRNLGLTERVHAVGYVPDASTLVRAFDAVILPSRTEALPYALLEAGAAGVAVAASAVGGIPHILDGGRAGLLVPAGDVPALARAVESLIADRTLRDRLGNALRERVRERFSLHRMVERTAALYETLGNH